MPSTLTINLFFCYTKKLAIDFNKSQKNKYNFINKSQTKLKHFTFDSRVSFFVTINELLHKLLQVFIFIKQKAIEKKYKVYNYVYHCYILNIKQTIVTALKIGELQLYNCKKGF